MDRVLCSTRVPVTEVPIKIVSRAADGIAEKGDGGAIAGVRIDDADGICRSGDNGGVRSRASIRIGDGDDIDAPRSHANGVAQRAGRPLVGQ